MGVCRSFHGWARAAPRSAVAELGVVRRRYALSMNQALFSLLLFATTTGFAASELTTVDEPEKATNTQEAALLKSTGMAASFKSSKRVFSRDGTKVAAIITTTDAIGDKPPVVRKFVQFFIDSDNWIEINLADPRIFFSHFVSEVSVSASDDSITVTAPKQRYCEVFFKSTGAFMDGATRERLAADFLRSGGGMLPR